jgi:hypothetical protein
MTDVDLEQRLRRALAARAGTITTQDLRPVVSERRAARVRWWLPLSAGLAAAVVVMLIFVVFRRPVEPERPERPIAPAASAPASKPAPKLSGTAAPVPSLDATTAAPSTTPSLAAAIPSLSGATPPRSGPTSGPLSGSTARVGR